MIQSFWFRRILHSCRSLTTIWIFTFHTTGCSDCRYVAQVADLKGHGEGIEGTNVHVVSALAVAGGQLISGGWDKTAAWRPPLEWRSMCFSLLFRPWEGLVHTSSYWWSIGIYCNKFYLYICVIHLMLDNCKAPAIASKIVAVWRLFFILPFKMFIARWSPSAWTCAIIGKQSQ